LRVRAKPKSPFEYTGGNLCLDFANTVNNRANDRREELLTDYERLVQWGEESGAISKKTAESLRDLGNQAPGNFQSTLRRAVQLRDVIYEVFSAVANQQRIPNTALMILNKEVQHVGRQAQISPANRHFVWEWLCPEGSLDSMLWPVARAAADLLTSDEIAKVRQCAADDCAWLFVDRTKNHRRRWCDMNSCGNRDKARRYYRRQKAG